MTTKQLMHAIQQTQRLHSLFDTLLMLHVNNENYQSGKIERQIKERLNDLHKISETL